MVSDTYLLNSGCPGSLKSLELDFLNFRSQIVLKSLFGL